MSDDPAGADKLDPQGQINRLNMLLKKDSAMETLCKLYLELANVVPAGCVSSREKVKQRQIDRYGIRLMMIAEGCAEPQKVAKEAIAEFAVQYLKD